MLQRIQKVGLEIEVTPQLAKGKPTAKTLTSLK